MVRASHESRSQESEGRQWSVLALSRTNPVLRGMQLGAEQDTLAGHCFPDECVHLIQYVLAAFCAVYNGWMMFWYQVL